MNTQPEALRLADKLIAFTVWRDDYTDTWSSAAEELRRLHWELSGVREHRDEMCKEVSRLHEQLEEAYKENQEQARILGMSAERELSLRAEIEQLKKIINKLVAENGSESLVSLLWGRTRG